MDFSFSPLVSRDFEPEFWTPQRLDRHSAWWGHVPFAFWLIATAEPRVLVELGTHHGVSYAAFCEAVSRLQLPTRCYAVDTWMGDPHAGTYSEDVYAELKNFHDQHYDSFSQLVRRTFDEASGEFTDGSIDLLHIDGYHTFEAVQHDFETWRQKLSPRAVVLFHDTNERQADFGVWRFLDELRTEAPVFEFLHAHGLGVVAVGSDTPEAIRRLCRLADGAQISAVRERFSFLGARWIANRENMVLKAHARALEEAIAQKDAHARAFKEVTAQKDAHARALEDQNLQKEKQITKLQTVVAEEQRQNKESIRRLESLEMSIREWREENKTLFESIRNEALARQLAGLRRVDCNERLPKKIAGFRLLIPWRRKRLSKLGEDYRLIVRSPLFDREWYLATNPDVAAKAIDPAFHYLVYGAGEGRSPGPAFHGATYLKSNPDVAASGMNPLVHYLLHGVNEGRLISAEFLLNANARGRNISTIDQPLRPSLTADPSRGMEGVGLESARSIDEDYSLAVPFSYVAKPRAASGRVAAIIHLYYDDLSVELRTYVRNIPGEVDVFITTADADQKKTIERAFGNWEAGRVEVRVTPNRGRDIAPKLIGFRDVYDRYDFVLHLHGKRSNYAPAWKYWRQYLLETLVGSPPVISSIFEAFERNSRLGMVAAQHFEPARHCIHWGNNLDHSRLLAARMGFSVDPRRVLDFPSGSMFWARSAALRPLLDLELTTDEFEPENGQEDGTLAHAVERLYFHVCERAGFDWIKVTRPELMVDTPAVAKVEGENELERFFHRHVFRLHDQKGAVPRTTPPASVKKPAATLLDAVRDHVLGTGRPIAPETRVAIGLATSGSEAALIRHAIDAALMSLNHAELPVERSVWMLDNGVSSENAAPQDACIVRLPSGGNPRLDAGHNRLLRAAFADGATIYIATNPDGILHRDAVGALVRMVEAHNGRALVEALPLPADDPKPYDPVTLDTPWVSGACLALSRSAFEELDNLNEVFLCDDEKGLPQRARASGFVLKTCPTALFSRAVANDESAVANDEISAQGVANDSDNVRPFHSTRALSSKRNAAPPCRDRRYPNPTGELITTRTKGRSMINWTNDGFELSGSHFTLEFGPNIATAKAEYPNFILMKSKELVDTYRRILCDNTQQFKNILELGVLKGGSTAFFNLLVSPQNHLAIDVNKHESALDRFSEDVRKSGRALVADYATSQADTQIILKKFSAISGAPPRFDFVVDDASHNFDLSLNSFNGLFPHVREGGIYALEDWGWAHWDGPWQQPDHGEFKNPALSNIVLLASLCCTSSPGIISHVEVTPGTTLIYRGPTPLGRDFSLEKTYLARGKKLQFI